jgi:hypothetical protein
MTTWLGGIPVDQLDEKAGQDRPGRAVLTVIAALGVAIGWCVSKAFRGTGWLAGRTWQIGAFFTEAVIYGFREGAGLPQKAAAAEQPPPGVSGREPGGATP